MPCSAKLFHPNGCLKGIVQKEAVDLAITKKMKRVIIEHAKTTRQKVENWIALNGPATISHLCKELDVEVKQVRYHALRLAQEKVLRMELLDDEPLFSLPIEED